jgi:uncharacterized membrane protein
LQITNSRILLSINALTLVLIFIILALPTNVLRIVIGLPFVLFFPGYVLITVLFPRKESLSDIERIALSFGMSLAVVPLNGLLLNYLPWGINLHSILISLSIFIVAMSIIAWLRQRRLSEDEKFSVTVNIGTWGKQTPLGKVLSIVLVFTVLGLLGVLVYTIAVPRTSEQYTEFYVLNSEGKAEDYPENIVLGETGSVILGIINHERLPTTYTVDIQIDGSGLGMIGPITLQDEEKAEVIAEFTPQTTGDRQKVEFLLFKDDSAEPYLNLHIWINVN